MMHTRVVALTVAAVVVLGLGVPVPGASGAVEVPDDVTAQIAAVTGVMSDPSSVGDAEAWVAVAAIADSVAAGEVSAQSLLDTVLPLLPGFLEWLLANATAIVTAVLPILPVLVDAVTQLVNVMFGGGAITTTTIPGATTTTTVPSTTTTTTRCWFFCG